MQKLGTSRCDFLDGIGGADTDDRVISGQTLKNASKKRWPGEHLLNNLVRPAN
jgi:hypothetical protein